MEGEVDAGQEYEQGDHVLHRCVEARDRGVLGGESSRGHGGECTVDRLEGSHTEGPQQEPLHHREQCVYAPEERGGMPNPGPQPVR